MKLSFEIEKESKLDSESLQNNTISKLRQSDYGFERKSGGSIVFYLQGWGGPERFDKVNGGLFQILVAGPEKKVRLSYYINHTYELIILLVFITMSLFFGVPFLFLSVVLIIIVFVRLSVAKSKCREMLDQITYDK